MATLAHKMIDDLMVLVHGEAAPDDEEWHAYCAAFRSMRPRVCLVVTNGAGPNARQRAELTDLAKTQPPRAQVLTAVMTDSELARGILTAINWVYPGLKPFRRSEFAGALRFLGSEHLLDRVVAQVGQFRTELVGKAI